MTKTPNSQPVTGTGEEPISFVFSLYVAGASPNSIRAINNLREICDKHIPGRYRLEVIDVYQQPQIARSEQIIALPLLIRRFPQPERRLIGDLSDTAKVLRTLALTA